MQPNGQYKFSKTGPSEMSTTPVQKKGEANLNERKGTVVGES
jgi:hypothetical protein